MTYFLLFISSFVSATLFPLGSEALFLYDLNEGYNLTLLLFVATIGNTLGSCVNYFLGYQGETFCERKGYISKQKILKYKLYFQRFGMGLLLLSWMPIIGDPITFVAGIFKYKFKTFFILVLISKFSRYLLLSFVI